VTDSISCRVRERAAAQQLPWGNNSVKGTWDGSHDGCRCAAWKETPVLRIKAFEVSIGTPKDRTGHG